MDKDVVRAYLWQDIIRLGFSPSGSKDQKSWLHQYGQSLKAFWKVKGYPKAPSQKNNCISATIDSSISISMTYEYSINHNQKFSVRLMHTPPEKNKGLMWLHDMDGEYFTFPNQCFLNYHKGWRRTAVINMDTEDIEAVIDSLIMHPTPHQHIESPLENHDIRIGGALLNPYLYLFHLRVQLCPLKETRITEKERLISLFESAIQQDTVIAPNELMKIPK